MTGQQWMCVCGHNRAAHEMGAARRYCRYTRWERGGRSRCGCPNFTAQPDNEDR